jgi:signal transduction histidine kinase
MRSVSLRGRMADQQRLLDRMEWPPWMRVGMPAAAAALGAVAVWDHVHSSPFVDDPPTSTVPGAALIAVSVLPWASFLTDRFWHRPAGIDLRRHHLAFSIAVLAPLATIHVGGEWLGVAGFDAQGPQLSLMILLLLAAQTAACSSAGVTVAVTVAIFAIILGRAALSAEIDPWFVWLVATTLPLLGGLAMRSNFVALQRLREAQEALARQVVAEERRRVAREVHDTVAHTLAVTMLHLTAARMAVERAPERAVAALEEAERQGRAGMGDIRRVVHLLRAADEEADESAEAAASPPVIERALPTVAELPDLVASYEAAGLAVAYDATAAGGAVPPAVGLALYRVAQESLTNAARHGEGDAQVRLCVDGSAAELTVRNRCRSEPGDVTTGMGLTGMHERVVGLGGEFRAGPDGERGTWQVSARIPTEAWG